MLTGGDVVSLQPASTRTLRRKTTMRIGRVLILLLLVKQMWVKLISSLSSYRTIWASENQWNEHARSAQKHFQRDTALKRIGSPPLSCQQFCAAFHLKHTRRNREETSHE